MFRRCSALSAASRRSSTAVRRASTQGGGADTRKQSVLDGNFAVRSLFASRGDADTLVHDAEDVGALLASMREQRASRGGLLLVQADAALGARMSARMSGSSGARSSKTMKKCMSFHMSAAQQQQMLAKNRKARDDEAQVRMLSPDGTWRLRWLGVMAVLMILASILTPLQLAFIGDFQASGGAAWFAINLLIDVIELVDIVLSFRTGVKIDGVISMQPKVVAAVYLRGAFFFDLLAGLPLGYWDLLGYDAPAARFLRLLKVLRLRQLAKVIEEIATHAKFNPSIVRLAKIFLVVLLVWHWIASSTGSSAPPRPRGR